MIYSAKSLFRTRVTAHLAILVLAWTLLPSSVTAQIVLHRLLLNGDALSNGGTWAFSTSSTVSPNGTRAAVVGQISTGAVALATSPTAAPSFRSIAITGGGGTPVPDAPAVVRFSSFLDVFVDDAERVVFRAGLSGATGPGLFIDDRGALSTIARPGQPVPPSAGLDAGVSFANLATALGAVSFSNGRALFLALLAGGSVTSSDDLTMWRYDAADGSLTLLAREGTRWRALGQPLVNAQGGIAFSGGILAEPSSTDGVLASGNPDALDALAQESQPAPGTTANFLANDFPLCSQYVINGLTINDLGEVAFVADLTQAPQPGLWRRGPGSSASVFKIARAGDPLPALGSPPPLMGTPSTPRLGGGTAAASAGAIAWRSAITGTSVAPGTAGVLFRHIGAGSPTTPEVVARGGSPAPGETPGVLQDGVPTAYALNASGQMFIRASFLGGPIVSPTTAWCAAAPGGTMYKLLRSGDTVVIDGVPGLSVGQLLNADIDQSTINGPQSGRPSAMSDTGGRSGSGIVVLSISVSSPNSGVTNGLFWTSITPELAGACCRGSTCALTAQSSCPPGFAQHFSGTGSTCNILPNTITPCCLANFNAASGVSVQDIFDFLAAWFTMDPRADINAANGVTVQDIFDFLAAWFAGCA